MICEPCKKQDHPNCPSVQLGIDENRPSAALSPEGMKVQLSGLCPCQHRVPFVKSDIGTEFVAQIDAAVVPA